MKGNVWENNILLTKTDHLVHEVYRVAKKLPSNERFGIISQLLRAIISVPLNMIEGYSRFSRKDHARFLEISFGSLKEAHYLIEFSWKEGWINDEDYRRLEEFFDEIERMLYAKIKTMREAK